MQNRIIMMISALIGGAVLAVAAQTMSGTTDTKVVKVPFQKDKWKLEWSDEFKTGTLPTPTNWIYDEGAGQNNEVQYYTRNRRENVFIENGMLHLVARQETMNGKEYTSARLTTKGKRSFLYGRVEARARVPEGRGTWPAIWLLGESIREVGWPKCGEIDILEYVGMDPGRVHANVHVDAYNHMKNNGKGNGINISRPEAEFHTYAVEWYKDRLEFFVDETRYLIYRKESDSELVWPFNKPHFLILNLAIGGDWAGQKGIDNSRFPHTFEVDYVRYYKQK